MSSEGITEELRALEKKKKVDYRVEVVNRTENEDKSDLDAQLASEKKRREEAELIVETIAMKDWESKKSSLLKNVPSEKREKIGQFIGDEPEKLAQIEAGLLLSGQDIEDYYDDNVQPQKSPSGKIGMLPQNQGRQTGRSPNYPNPVLNIYSDLYATIRSETATAQEKSEAEQILDDTFDQIGKGLRNRSRNNPYKLPSGCVTHCMNCGAVVEVDLGKGIPCPHCGHRFGIDKFPRNPKFQPT